MMRFWASWIFDRSKINIEISIGGLFKDQASWPQGTCSPRIREKVRLSLGGSRCGALADCRRQYISFLSAFAFMDCMQSGLQISEIDISILFSLSVYKHNLVYSNVRTVMNKLTINTKHFVYRVTLSSSLKISPKMLSTSVRRSVESDW